MKKSVAIIGSGIAGMSAAYFLRNDYDITLYEKNNYIGGHTNTVMQKDVDNRYIPIDTGFMVFNEVTYPNLTKLFKEISVRYKDTCMSFSVSHRESGLEYNGSGLKGLFTQKKNILNFDFIKMLMEINRFNSEALMVLEDESFDNVTIEEYLERKSFSNDLKEKYLIPMSSAVWSTPFEKMVKFPIKTLIRFFHNHGFLGLNTQHQWMTPSGGSVQYRDKITSFYRDCIVRDKKIISVESLGNRAKVYFEDDEKEFDMVIVAAHGDQAYKMLRNPNDDQARLLSCFKYQKNIVTLHSDPEVMPTIESNWSSWNYITRKDSEGNDKSYTVYWMNRLQEVSQNKNYFVSVNGEEFINQELVHKVINYEHPLFDIEAIKAQEELHILNDHSNPIYFCGSYFKYGFHEDALTSSVNLCEFLLGRKVL